MNLRALYGATYKPFFAAFRTKRLRQLCETFNITEDTEILDVGGSYPTFWKYSPIKPKVTLLNPKPSWLECAEPGFSTVVGDGRSLPFKDKSFDIVISNSVIEHLGCFREQQAFAKEIRRVGRRYWVQTPNRYFFIEPHFLAPMVHFLPRNTRKAVSRYVTWWGLTTHPTKQQVSDLVDEISLLSDREVRLLFPDSETIKEKWCGMTKSIIAYRNIPDAA
jgi:ubiquinone/menaquinone biosynthesis C-methylase UbiE